MTSALVRTHTTCGRCEVIHERCAVVTVKTIHASYQLVELCRQCLSELVIVINAHENGFALEDEV